MNEEEQLMTLAEEIIELCNNHAGNTLVTTGALAICLINIAQQAEIPMEAFIKAFTGQTKRMYQQDGRVMQ